MNTGPTPRRCVRVLACDRGSVVEEHWVTPRQAVTLGPDVARTGYQVTVERWERVAVRRPKRRRPERAGKEG